MGILLQLLGFIALVASLVLGIISIVNHTQNIVGFILLIIGISLVKIGRDVYYKGRKK